MENNPFACYAFNPTAGSAACVSAGKERCASAGKERCASGGSRRARRGGGKDESVKGIANSPAMIGKRSVLPTCRMPLAEEKERPNESPMLLSGSSKESNDGDRPRSKGPTDNAGGNVVTPANCPSAENFSASSLTMKSGEEKGGENKAKEGDAKSAAVDTIAALVGDSATLADETNTPICAENMSALVGELLEEEKTKENKSRKVGTKPKATTTTIANSGASKSVTAAPPQSITRPKRKYRQAQCLDGEVEILCFACRRNPSRKVQKSIGSFFKGRSVSTIPLCSRCRQPLKRSPKTKHGTLPTKCPFITRLEGYKKTAADNALPFDLSDSNALSIMRMPCSLCGTVAGMNGGGLTRLRVWPARHEGARNGQAKQCMGPFCVENLAPACGLCNLMKGHRTPRHYVEAARHIATHRAASLRQYESTVAISSPPTAPIELFGLYPHRFRNNISKRNRSNYITMSSTHTKTHSMTNEEFKKITSNPCHYCGKEPRPDGDPPHHNGLDRLDSDERVYSATTAVACCGDCNVMKYTHSEEVFLRHCLKVARFNRGKEFEREKEEVGEGDGTDDK